MKTPFTYYQNRFPAGEFRSRQGRLYDAIESRALAVLQGGLPVAGYEVFRQGNDFFYLTGVEVPQAYLVLNGSRRTSVLYVPHRDAKHAATEGMEPAAEDREALIELTGCDDVRGLECLASDLSGASVLYTPHNAAEGLAACQDTLRYQAKLIAADPWEAGPSRETRFAERLRAAVPGAEIRDLSPTLLALRKHKSPAELDVMREAGRLSALAVTEAMRATRPGVIEYQLGAIADYVFTVNGAQGSGYRAIIAGGRNIWAMHYFRNNSVLRDGDLVLMDYAPNLCNYTSDIGRMWPVNGTYTPVQRELYGFMVEYHKALLRRLRPAVLPVQVLAEAAADMAPYLKRHPFSKPVYEQAAQRVLQGDKAISHAVGMAVHDGSTYVDKTEPFAPGLVFALDPQMWVPEEELYVRVEDTVAITANGVENLTTAAPLELDAIEVQIRRPGGLLGAVPPLATS